VRFAETRGLTDKVWAIPIVAPSSVLMIGPVAPHREPMTPLTAALVDEARLLAKTMASQA
jgi:hypothetical protein